MDDSNLKKLEEELYGKGRREDIQKRMRRRIVFPGTLRRPEGRWKETARPVPSPSSNWSRRALKILLAAFAALFLVILAAFIFFYLGTRGQEAQVIIHAPNRVEAGALVTIPVAYKNVSGAALREMELTVVFPEGTLMDEEGTERPAPPRISLRADDLEKGKEAVREFRVRFFGPEAEEKRMEAILLYRPENLRAKFASRAEKAIVISAVPLALSWEMPETVSSGQEVTARIHYSGNSSRPFEGLSLRVDYPSGFQFRSADPAPLENDDSWEIGTLDTGKEGVIALLGTISGEGGEMKTFRAGLGIFNRMTREWKPYFETTGDTRIAAVPLFAQVFLRGERTGTVVPGRELQFSVRYSNNTEYPLKNVTVRVIPEGLALDMASIEIEGGGVFDAASRAIIWGPGNTPVLRELGPGQGGEFKFSIGTRSRPPMRGLGDTNLLVRLTSAIEAAGIPRELAGADLRSQDVIEFKVRSVVLFAGRTLHRSSPIPNSGPLPPKVGSKTTYAIVWEVRNFTNELRDTEARAALPPNVKWEGVISPQDAAVSFDAASSEVRWRIGIVPAGTGVLTPGQSAVFQVSVIPAERDAGQAITLAVEARLEARDVFTGEDIEERLDSLTTELRQDSGVSALEWRVVK